jgi:hypothetical protein
MMKKHLFLLLGALIALFIVPLNMHAYPTVYERLVLKEGGKIKKTIDLIGEVHLPENEIQSGAVECRLGDSEHNLILALDKIARRKSGEPVELFAEWSHTDRLNQNQVENAALKSGDESTWKSLISANWYNQCLAYIGTKFFALYRPEMHKNLIYSDADSYRKGVGIVEHIGNACKLMQGGRYTKGPRDPMRAIIFYDLGQLRTRVPADIYQKVEQLWNDYELEMSVPCSDFEKTKRSDKVTLAQMGFPMDFELIMKILGSKYSHIIVYAGNMHCKGVAEHLRGKFGFETVKKFGRNDADLSEVERARFNALEKAHLDAVQSHNSIERERIEKEALPLVRQLTPPLPANTWQLLLEGIEGF